MFPSFSVAASGLEMDQKYVMKMICNTCDEKRYKYINSKWTVCGKAESHIEDLLSYTHTDSPASGKQWMLNKVCFKKVKLTNNRSAPKGQVSKSKLKLTLILMDCLFYCRSFLIPCTCTPLVLLL